MRALRRPGDGPGLNGIGRVYATRAEAQAVMMEARRKGGYPLLRVERVGIPAPVRWSFGAFVWAGIAATWLFWGAVWVVVWPLRLFGLRLTLRRGRPPD